MAEQEDGGPTYKCAEIFCAPATNPSGPAEILWDLYMWYAKAVDAARLSGRSISDADMAVWQYCLSKLAGEPAAPRNMLHLLSQHSSPMVFCEVAKNPATPSVTLRQLYTRAMAEPNQDGWPIYCLEMIAGNPSTPEDLLHSISQHVLELLSHAKSATTRLAVAAHKETSRETLERLAHDVEPSVRIAAKQNQHTPPSPTMAPHVSYGPSDEAAMEVGDWCGWAGSGLPLYP